MRDSQAKSDRLIDARDPLRALSLLTRLPMPWGDAQRGAASAWAWPLVGLGIGWLAGMAALAALGLGLPAAIAAGVALICAAMATGALHEDGLADCADGIWGGLTPDRRLEIMRDSRIGSYGVLALILAIGLKWLALTELILAGHLWPAVLVPAILSRAAMPAVMVALPFAREDGLARHVGRPSGRTAGIAAILAAIMSIAGLGLIGVVPVITTALAVLVLTRMARAKLSGQTGDVLGAVQMVSEIAALLTLTALLG